MRLTVRCGFTSAGDQGGDQAQKRQMMELSHVDLLEHGRRGLRHPIKATPPGHVANEKDHNPDFGLLASEMRAPEGVAIL